MPDTYSDGQQWDVHEESPVAAAQRRGIPVSRSAADRRVVEFGNGRFRQRIRTMSTSLTTDTAVRIAKDKRLTYQILNRAGLPTPVSHACTSADEAVSLANRIGYPVVVKPIDGNRARGVSIGLTRDGEVANAFESAVAFSTRKTVLIEGLVPGNQHRVLVIDGKISGAYRRQTASVTGTGRHTVQELIDYSNEMRRREAERVIERRQITLDEEVIRILELQHLSPESVPELGELVLVKPPVAFNGSLNVNCTNVIHPENVTIFKMASAAVGLDIAALDVVTSDITRPLHDTGGAIVEVNSMPSFKAHVRPRVGKPDDIGEDIIAMLYPPGAPIRVPVIAVQRGPGSEATISQIDDILSRQGLHTGHATIDQITTDGVRQPNQTGSVGAALTQLLRNPAIDIVVLESDDSTNHDDLEIDLLVRPSDPIEEIDSTIRRLLQPEQE